MTEITTTNVKSAMWTENHTYIGVTLEDGIVWWVPDDMANRHRVALEEWLNEGNQITPYERTDT